MTTVTESDLYYLRSILRQLTTVKESLADIESFSLGGLAFADNVDWLDCFIDANERALSPPRSPQETAGS